MKTTLESQIQLQIGASPKTGIYEVFVSHQNYYDYYELGVSPSPNMNQKMFAVIWEGSMENLCLEEKRAWAELHSIAKEEGVTL